MNSQDKICGNCIFFTDKGFNVGYCKIIQHRTNKTQLNSIYDEYDITIIVNKKYWCTNHKISKK